MGKRRLTMAPVRLGSRRCFCVALGGACLDPTPVDMCTWRFSSNTPAGGQRRWRTVCELQRRQRGDAQGLPEHRPLLDEGAIRSPDQLRLCQVGNDELSSGVCQARARRGRRTLPPPHATISHLLNKMRPVSWLTHSFTSPQSTCASTVQPIRISVPRRYFAQSFFRLHRFTTTQSQPVQTIMSSAGSSNSSSAGGSSSASAAASSSGPTKEKGGGKGDEMAPPPPLDMDEPVKKGSAGAALPFVVRYSAVLITVTAILCVLLFGMSVGLGGWLGRMPTPFC